MPMNDRKCKECDYASDLLIESFDQMVIPVIECPQCHVRSFTKLWRRSASVDTRGCTDFINSIDNVRQKASDGHGNNSFTSMDELHEAAGMG